MSRKLSAENVSMKSTNKTMRDFVEFKININYMGDV